MDICRKTNRQTAGTNQNEFCDTMGLGQFIGTADYHSIIMKKKIYDIDLIHIFYASVKVGK